MAIEGHVRESFEQDLKVSMRLLGPMLSSIEGKWAGLRNAGNAGSEDERALSP